ncbi:helix-turn-helix domain-containing protein [Actinomadura kijaniata]|uniref:DNA-binding transcriptional ArsR family regulator n=1 Tax=Actinomadura namibiensis TaxID=182080 RepID=A0A7W3LY65_ACTNM|nr:helix-turn-helix domain-containing protein [Actinomadura namibiensis]MBA8956453.1 DNA-binding transcriptional ArsR family regulator [Actinomadura namibiensis]
MTTLDLLAHPVRLRIVHAMADGRTRTTAELADRVPGAHRATVYRHVAALAEGGVLEVTDERRVRGAVERHYRLRHDRAVITPETAAAMSADDHRRAFTAAMAVLLAEFDAYLDRDAPSPAGDEVGYRQHVLWLTPAERADLIERMRAAITPHLGNAPGDGRAPHLLSPILFPTGEPAR